MPEGGEEDRNENGIQVLDEAVFPGVGGIVISAANGIFRGGTISKNRPQPITPN